MRAPRPHRFSFARAMSSPSPAPNPSTIFVAWLADHEANDEQSFAALVQDHAEHAVELVRLRADWMCGQASVDQPSLSKRLEAQFGENVDPEVSLRGSDERPESFSSEVLRRLSGRSASFGRYQYRARSLAAECTRTSSARWPRISSFVDLDDLAGRSRAGRVLLLHGGPLSGSGRFEAPFVYPSRLRATSSASKVRN